jgi:hypothetical protein
MTRGMEVTIRVTMETAIRETKGTVTITGMAMATGMARVMMVAKTVFATNDSFL